MTPRPTAEERAVEIVNQTIALTSFVDMHAIIEKHILDAEAAVREECAKIVETMSYATPDEFPAGLVIADAIRKGGKE